MEVNVIREEKSLDAKLVVKIHLSDFEEEALKSLKAQKQKIQLPGFRKGKVPVGIAKKYLWEGIVKEELEKNLEKGIENHLSEQNIDIIRPLLPIIDTDKEINLTKDTEFEFQYNIGLIDEFELDFNKAFKDIKKYHIKVSEADIEKEIDMIRETYGDASTPESIEDDPEIRLSMQFSELDDEGQKLEGGITKSLVKKFDELNASLKKALIGHKQEDEFEVNMRSFFRSNKTMAEFLGIEELEAEDANDKFLLKLVSINKFTKAELNEELFKKAANKETEEDFRKHVEETLEKNYENNASAYLNDDMYHALLEKTNLNLPIKFIDLLFEEELKAKKEEKTAEEIAHERKHFDEQIKWSLIIKRLIAKYEIKVEPQEIAEEAYAYLNNMYMQYGMYQTPEQMNGILSEFLQKAENVTYIKERVEVSKVFDKLQEENEFKVKEISIEAFRKLNEEKQNHNHEH